MGPLLQEFGDKLLRSPKHPARVGDEDSKEHPADDQLPLNVSVDNGKTLGDAPASVGVVSLTVGETEREVLENQSISQFLYCY